MAMADSHGLPLAVSIASGSSHEVTLVDQTLEGRFVRELPEVCIGDKAYDSIRLEEELRSKGVELIAPERARSVTRPTKGRSQDGRALRRYKRRWKVERLFAWLFASRKLVTRYERKPLNFLAFVHLACLRIYLKAF